MNGIEKRVLYIEGIFDSGSTQCGTGILLHCQDDKNGFSDIIITCLHVVENNGKPATKVKVWDKSVGYSDSTGRFATINKARLDNAPPDAVDLVILQLSEDLAYNGIISYGEATTNDNIYVYGYPMGKKLITKINRCNIRPRKRKGSIDSFNAGDGIYTFHGDTAAGISGGPVFRQKKLIGIFRGKWVAEGERYSEGIIIGKYWIEKLCEKAGYKLEIPSYSLDISFTTSINIALLIYLIVSICMLYANL